VKVRKQPGGRIVRERKAAAPARRGEKINVRDLPFLKRSHSSSAASGEGKNEKPVEREAPPTPNVSPAIPYG